MEIKSNQKNLDLITLTNLPENPYGYYILWNRKQGTDVLNPNMYDIETLVKWIETNEQKNTNIINPFTNNKLTYNEIKRIKYYHKIFCEFPNKQSYLDKLHELNSEININEINDMDYNDIFRKIFLEIIKQNVSENEIKMSNLKEKYDINLLRAVIKPEFFTECFDIERGKDNYNNMDHREVAKNLVYNEKNKNRAIIRRSSLKSSKNHTIPFAISYSFINKEGNLEFTSLANGYRNGIGIISFGEINRKSDVAFADTAESVYDSEFFYDFLTFYYNLIYIAGI